MMHIEFCMNDGGSVLYTMESNDVAGVLAAAKGDKVIIDKRIFKYNSHILNHYVDNGLKKQELLIYLDEE
ncbi:thymidylate synthase [Cytobacillus oceanisediminis]|nr:thymidylate synthase [Cytobacillus oceanisediminis]